MFKPTMQRKRNEIRMFITEKAKTQELNEKKDEEKKTWCYI